MRSMSVVVSMCVGLLFAACADHDRRDPLSAGPVDRLQALQQEDAVRYEVVNLGTLGGRQSRGNGINSRGWVAGYSDDVGNRIRRGVVWKDGAVIELGTLDGFHSNVPWSGVNNTGLVVGITETANVDSLGQRWSCTAFFFPAAPTGRTCVGFVWESGVMKALPTLGGQNGFATAVNNRGQAVGWAETAVNDPTCTPPQVRQFRAVLWEPRRGTMRELRPLPGDSTSAATAINERGQVVGISGDCDVAVGQASSRHAVIWDGDRVTELENLGGAMWHTPMAINDRGDAVGFSLSTDPEDPGFRAAFWSRHGGVQNLGTLEGDASSQAHSINARGQVVGISAGGEKGRRAFIWREGGEMIDLNELVLPGYAGTLLDARHISDSGVITGAAEHWATGDTVPFVATPVRR